MSRPIKSRAMRPGTYSMTLVSVVPKGKTIRLILKRSPKSRKS